MVRENLWWALKHLRFKDQERDLWIDALCIDQSRPEEKNHQVQLMGHIYSKAFQVLIWLGQEGEDSDVAMECMIDVLQNKYYLRDYDNRELNALRKLFARDYWSRMWILQEVVLAACLTIHCGSKSFKWRALYELYLITPLLEEPGHTTRTVIDARENHWHPNGQISNTLSSLLSRCYHRKVTDQKDNIYAILGIASDCQNGEIQVDYSRSIPELCSDLLFLNGKSRRPRNDLSSTTLDFFEDLLDWILRIESARRLPERETWPPVPRGWPYNIEQANERGRQMNGESFELQRLAEPHPSAWKARKALWALAFEDEARGSYNLLAWLAADIEDSCHNGELAKAHDRFVYSFPKELRALSKLKLLRIALGGCTYDPITKLEMYISSGRIMLHMKYMGAALKLNPKTWTYTMTRTYVPTAKIF
jgi:hypothetical protein